MSKLKGFTGAIELVKRSFDVHEITIERGVIANIEGRRQNVVIQMSGNVMVEKIPHFYESLTGSHEARFFLGVMENSNAMTPAFSNNTVIMGYELESINRNNDISKSLFCETTSLEKNEPFVHYDLGPLDQEGRCSTTFGRTWISSDKYGGEAHTIGEASVSFRKAKNAKVALDYIKKVSNNLSSRRVSEIVGMLENYQKEEIAYFEHLQNIYHEKCCQESTRQM